MGKPDGRTVPPFPVPVTLVGITDAPVTVADGQSMVLEPRATIDTTLDIAGRADIYGTVTGRITVYPSGWLTLYGQAEDIWVEPGGTIRVKGLVYGRILGEGSSDGVVPHYTAPAQLPPSPSAARVRRFARPRRAWRNKDEYQRPF